MALEIAHRLDIPIETPRHGLIWTVSLFALLLPLVVLPGCTWSSVDRDVNPIVKENLQPGTDAWQIGRPGFSISTGPDAEIEGYASTTSLNKGEQVAFQVSVEANQKFSADFYRMGWYGGLGGRLMTHLGPLAGIKQRACKHDRTTGLVDCAWSPTFFFAIPDTWTSGVYLVLLTNAQNYQNYMTFVVRDDNRAADFLYQQSVSTYQAYNNYPTGSGKSLYEFNSHGAPVPATRTLRAGKVSFDRPYANGSGSGQLLRWEQYYISWLEHSGYDVTYSTSMDTHTNGDRLLNFKGFLSVGHDEYWSSSMRNAVTAARDARVNLGFFGSNTAYWHVRFEPSATGAINRVMVCYKSTLDPVTDSDATVLWRDAPVNQPEQALVGVQYSAHLKDDGRGAAYIVRNSSNWVWDGAEVSDGTQIFGVLGVETDRLMSEYTSPPNTSYTMLSRSPVIDVVGRREYASSSIYEAMSGAWVFATGTNNWSLGLGAPAVIDVRVQRATANVLRRFLDTGPPRSMQGPPRR